MTYLESIDERIDFIESQIEWHEQRVKAIGKNPHSFFVASLTWHEKELVKWREMLNELQPRD